MIPDLLFKKIYNFVVNRVGFTKPTLFVVGIVMPTYNFLFIPSKFPKVTFYGLSSSPFPVRRGLG